MPNTLDLSGKNLSSLPESIRELVTLEELNAVEQVIFPAGLSSTP
jgi:Leucine-rich repeat (LRR) protein